MPTGAYQFTDLNQNWEVRRRYKRAVLDRKLPVVCRTCNNTWMSELEDKHAKPAMAELIVSNKRVSLSPERLKSIANFAFKSVVIADRASTENPKLQGREPFFTTRARYAFRESLTIPDNVQMWLAAFEENTYGLFNAIYYPSPPETVPAFESYALTFGAGFLLIQVVASRPLRAGAGNFRFDVTQGAGWDRVSTPFWPNSGRAILRPPEGPLNFAWGQLFAHRWNGTDIDTDPGDSH